MNFTPLARPVFNARWHAVERWKASTDEIRRIQTEQLTHILGKGQNTLYGRKFAFNEILKAEDPAALFASRLPRTEYEDIRPLVMRMVKGEGDILWPGVVKRYAQSSGTSGGKSKYIPITDEGLHTNHYGGGRDTVASYLHLNPHSRLFGGKSFILGGSFANELGDVPRGVKVGDLSASLIDNINPLANLFRVPDKHTALLSDWNVKLPALVEASLKEDIRSISGVPSWFMTVIEKVIERAGAANIHEVWPNLEVFFHGGISFAPYREQYLRLTDPSRMHYLETYNASEGFFAVQDTANPSEGMLLLLDTGVFYEFAPLGGGTPVPAWEVEDGRTYELLISSVNGLWRYSPGDTVRVLSRCPLRIGIAGRTHSFINAFGEELMVHNAEAAIARACKELGCNVANYTAAPFYALADGTRGHHQWLIEWTRPPRDIEEFASVLDRELRSVNSDYDAKRSGGIFLDPPQITVAAPGLFERWLASTGKLGGQRKVPRLCNNRDILDRMLKMNNTSHTIS